MEIELEFKLKEYELELKEQELSQNTIKQYIVDVKQLIQHCKVSRLDEFTKEKLIEYKDYISSRSKPSTTNNKIIIINKYLTYVGLEAYKLKILKIQKVSTLENSLTLADYKRLLRMAKKLKKEKIRLIMRTFAETGIRISELKFVTVEAVKRRVTQIDNKKKIRNVYFNKSLAKELLEYCKQNNIKTGIIFHRKANR